MIVLENAYRDKDHQWENSNDACRVKAEYSDKKIRTEEEKQRVRKHFDNVFKILENSKNGKK